METKKEIELVEVEYWTCNDNKHRHRTKEVAERCIYKSCAKKKEHKRWSKAELYELLDKKLAGENMAQLSRDMCMSNSNMTRLTNKAHRIRLREERTGEEYVIPHERGSNSYM